VAPLHFLLPALKHHWGARGRVLRPAPFRDPKTSPRGHSPPEHPSSNHGSVPARGICGGRPSSAEQKLLVGVVLFPDPPAPRQLPPWAPSLAPLTGTGPAGSCQNHQGNILGLKTTAACFEACLEDLGMLRGCPEPAEQARNCCGGERLKDTSATGEGCWAMGEGCWAAGGCWATGEG